MLGIGKFSNNMELKGTLCNNSVSQKFPINFPTNTLQKESSQ